MKPINEILKDRHILNVNVGEDGFSGLIFLHDERGKERIGTIVVSNGLGWDHVSVCFEKWIPGWQKMCEIKSLCFLEDEAAIQIHPTKLEYVNNIETCMHLWRKQDGMELPPSFMVGLKKGQTMGDLAREVEEYEREHGYGE